MTEYGRKIPNTTIERVREYITESFGVEYSLAYIYQILKKVELSGPTVRPYHYKANSFGESLEGSKFCC